MGRKVRSSGLVRAAALLLALSVILSAAKRGSALQGPPPEAWLPGRAAGRLGDLDRAPREARQGFVPAGAESSIPAWSRMVFASIRDGNWEIYLDDGSSQIRLTSNSKSDVYPRLNRGCTRIAFASDRAGNFEIYAMNLDGSGVTRLTYDGQDDYSPSWSPDGTRIAFESYRTGDGDIYVMNADGSNPVRLTTDPAWDGQPAWSPDGSQILFTSYRNSVNRIWRMDADGSDQLQLSDQPYSGHPAWGAAGRIAFDADADGDGWEELWTMSPDGSNESQGYDPPEADTNASVGSWSPDGLSVVFAHTSWIYYQGNWYWTVSYLDAWDSASGSVVRLSSQGEDMFPDWQTVDTTPPTSSVSALPVRSPAEFAVRWSGRDNGPAGLVNYDVQIRDGAGGAWTDLLPATTDTSIVYLGEGGHTYSFRSRARDHAGNVEAWPDGPDASTTVEAMAPVTAVEALAPYSRGQITVRWSGVDPGGSGILTYEVQVRDGEGAWTDWQSGTSPTEAPFDGEPGHTYDFRSRGIDWAGNVEEWPPANGDASTAFFVWRMTGTLRDNRETPVMGGEVGLIPEPLAVIPSDAEGHYTAYEGTAADAYLATWEKAGYSPLPPTDISGTADIEVDMVLPPLDNAVQNWGFESGSLGPEWLAGGDLLPGTRSDVRHTGGFSAAIGQDTGIFYPWINLSNRAGDSTVPAIDVDSEGVLHAVWRDISDAGYSDLFYAQREPGGDWSAPVPITNDEDACYEPHVAVQPDGTVHVAWEGWPAAMQPEIFYSRRSPGGTWSGPVNVSQSAGNSWPPDIALGADGAVHLVWADDSSGNDEILYARRSPEGAWSAAVSLSQNAGESKNPRVAADPDGTVHVVWQDETPGNDEILYAWRDSGGTWSPPLNLSDSPGWSASPIVAAGGDGSVHVAWYDKIPGYSAILYARRSADGTWSDRVDVSGDQSHEGVDPEMALGPDGSVHLAWNQGKVWLDLLYARRAADGVWSGPEVAGNGEYPDLRVDSAGTAHVTWQGWQTGNPEVYYARRSAAGQWSGWSRLSNTPQYSLYPRLALGDDGDVHIVWQDGLSGGGSEILYAESTRAGQTGDSILSQSLTVPAEEGNPTLSFWYWLEGTPASTTSWLAVQVDDGAATTGLLTASAVRDWTHAWFDLSPWASQAVTLRFVVHQTEGKPAAWGAVDEVSVGPAYPDLWVTKTASSASLLPGGQVQFTLTYGNRGGAGAGDVVLTETLPPELQFVSADPWPTTITPYLTWAVGDLPPGSGPATIVLVTSTAPGALLMGLVTNTIEISSASVESETLNNEAHAQVRIGQQVFFPAVLREY